MDTGSPDRQRRPGIRGLLKLPSRMPQSLSSGAHSRDPLPHAGQVLLRITRAQHRGVGADCVSQDLRQRATSAVAAQPPLAGGTGIAQRQLRHWGALRLPLKPAVDQARVRRRLHSSAKTLDAGLHQFEAVRRDAPVFLPVDLLDRMGPSQRERRERQRLHNTRGCETQAQTAAIAARDRCGRGQDGPAITGAKPASPLMRNWPSRHGAAKNAAMRSDRVIGMNRDPIATISSHKKSAKIRPSASPDQSLINPFSL
jgi:hypothetical protein